MSENEPVLEGEVVQGEIVQVEAEPSAIRARQERPAGLASRVLVWAGAALTLIGREVGLRLVHGLLDAWEERASRPSVASSDGRSRPGVQQATSPRTGRGGRGRRWRWRKG